MSEPNQTTRTETTSRVRSLLEPVIKRLERMEETADSRKDDVKAAAKDLKIAARAAGIKGMKYAVFVALCYVNPKEALSKVSNYVEGMEKDLLENDNIEQIPDMNSDGDSENDDDADDPVETQ